MLGYGHTVLAPVQPRGGNSLVPSGRDKGRSGQRVRQFTTRPGDASQLTGVACYLGPDFIRLPFRDGPCDPALDGITRIEGHSLTERNV